MKLRLLGIVCFSAMMQAPWAWAATPFDKDKEAKECLAAAVAKLPRGSQGVSSRSFLVKEDQKPIGREPRKNERWRRYGGEIGVVVAGQPAGYSFVCMVQDINGDGDGWVRDDWVILQLDK